MSNGGFATVNENLRLQQVYATLLNFGGAELVDRIGLGGLTRAMQRWIYRVGEPIPALSPAVKTRVMLESLGPTYVKLGQIVSSQANVLPDDWRTQLDLLQNEVPPVPYEI
jgi:ubiquinone biosynthesis protein